ncbi:growth/differentiation factor 8-like [Stegodyphus dumicola]|uniref:growth/differentiation factor 8-like n=1 Tax=Stegodyphus dumicola TaxID=202533 RepID=UPI0015A843AD|nr:growth/differentiation factor 8-like [Stegodyphus dumicola]
MAVSFRISKWLLFATHVLSVVFPCVWNTSLYAHHMPEDSLDQDVQEWDTEEEENSISEERTSNCSRCIEKEERRAMRIQTIKNQILTQLGMREAPNVTQKDLPHIPPLDNLLDNYNMQSDSPTFTPGPEYGDEDDFYITAEKVLAFAQTPPEPVDVDSGDKQLYFKLSTSLRNAQIQNAHLWVYIRPTRHVLHRNITLYEISRSSFGQAEFIQIRKKGLDKKNKHGNWLVFDVKKTVTNWLKHPKENFGFALHSSGSDVQRLIVTPEENYTENMPFVEIKVEKQRHRRSKRMIGLNCEENADEVRCCRYPLTVDFEEFGWDWIIAPKRYEANYCSGECPYVFLQKYPHTHLVQQANPQGSAGPCCAPRKMSSISMLYFDADFNIIYGMLPGMVVDRCGCS